MPIDRWWVGPRFSGFAAQCQYSALFFSAQYGSISCPRPSGLGGQTREPRMSTGTTREPGQVAALPMARYRAQISFSTTRSAKPVRLGSGSPTIT